MGSLKDLHRRVMMSVARAVLRAVNDENGRQQLQIEVTKGELIDGVERMQNYGHSSNPHVGADAAVVFVAGNREQGIIVAVDDRRYRPTGLEPGEVVFYTDENETGHRIHFKRGREIHSVTGDVTIVQKPTEIRMIVGGQVLLLNSSGFFHNGKNIGAPHTHNNVTPGVGVSGVVT